MTSPGSETAWHFSSFGTEPDDNQLMECSSVPSAWLAKVPKQILHVSALRFCLPQCFVSKSLQLMFALQLETSVGVSEMLEPSSSGNQILKVFAEGKSWAFCIVALVTYQGRYNGLNHMFCPLQSLLSRLYRSSALFL